MLPTFLLSSKDVKRDPEAVALEVSVLDLLISACEKEENRNLKVHLESHKRKLQLLTAVAGMDKTASGSVLVSPSRSLTKEKFGILLAKTRHYQLKLQSFMITSNLTFIRYRKQDKKS